MLIPLALQNFLDVVNTQPPVYVPQQNRDLFEGLSAYFALPKVDVAWISNRSVSLATHEVAVRIYHPQPQKKLPVIFYFHGGGHMCGSLDSYDALCRRLALTSNCVLVSVAYRLAPEFPYPAGLTDCLAVIKQRATLLKEIEVTSDAVFLAGDSAGGNLALSVAYALKKQGDNALKGLVLIYPSVDYSMQHNSFERNGEGFLLTKDKVKWYFDHYFAHGGDRIGASPLYFPQLNLLPPMYLALAEYDPLFDEGVLLAKKMRDLGGTVVLEEFAGMVHVFAQLETLVPTEVVRLHQSINNFISQFIE